MRDWSAFRDLKNKGFAGYEKPQKPTYLKTNNGYMAVGDDGVPTPVVGADGGVLHASGAGAGGAQKPMPVTALRMIEDNKNAIFTANNISGMMKETLEHIESGSLKFGPLSNWSNRALNWAGQSTPESQQYANAQANFEKMRNDSLRLAEKARAAGVNVTLERYAGLWHVFQAHVGMLRAADQAMQSVVKFLKAQGA